jgi:hypothetical protein
MGKSSPKPPPAPDYAAAAQAQGAANLEAARLTARISNPNINTPYGGQRVSFGKPTTNETAYKQAMDAYNKALEAQKAYNDRRAQTPSVSPGQFPTTGPLPSQPTVQPTVGGAVGGPPGLRSPEGFEPQYGGALQEDQFAQMGVSDNFQYDPMTGGPIARTGGETQPTMGGFGSPGGLLGMQPGYNEPAPDYSQFGVQGYTPYVNEKGELVAPTREQFTSMTDLDTPFIEQFLSPEQQKILEAQQRVDLGLAGLGETALGTAQRVIGQPFNPNLRDLQTELGGYGQVQGAPDLLGMGRASADVQAGQLPQLDLSQFGRAQGNVMPQRVSYGPMEGQYGYAQGGVGVPQLRAFQPENLPGLQGINLMQLPAAQGLSAEGLPQLRGVDTSRLPGLRGETPTFGARGEAAPLQQQTALGLGGVQNVQYAPNLGIFGLARGEVPTERLQRGIDTSELAAMPVSAGTTGQQAILSRVMPQIQQQRQMLETQLANQGIPRGSEAYNRAITEQQQQENDAIQQAALQGLQLDMQARQQGFGEQQAQAQFANQAALGQFGMGTTAADVYNRALQQNVGTALTQQQAQNAAQQQDFAQRVAAGEFGNAAQQALFGAGMQQASLANQAAGQNFQQQLAAQQFANQARAQGFGEQQAQAALASQQRGQLFDERQAVQQAANQLRAQGLSEQQVQAALSSQQRGQLFGEQQAVQQAYNQAGLQQQQAALANQDAYNRAVQQNLAAGLNIQQAQNAAAQQAFGQQLSAQQLQNQAAAQNQDAALRAYQALLSGQAQGFGQQMDVQAARNAALAQNQAIAAQQQQMANAAQLQQYNQALQNAQFGNTALQQSLQQQLALRNQPINEIAALMSGVQVNMPQFQGYQGANVAAAPIFAGTQAAGDFAQRNYSNQVGAYNAQLGLLSGLAGAAGGYFGGR